MSQKQKIVHSFFWKLLERFGSQAISMFVTILLARILLPSEYGIIAILVVFIDLANVIIDGGLNTALIQKRNADNVDFSTILYVSIGLALIIYILLFWGAPWIAQFYDNSLLSPVLFSIPSMLYNVPIYQNTCCLRSCSIVHSVPPCCRE